MGLRRLFNQLVLQTGGDVEEAMDGCARCRSAATSIAKVDLERSSRG